MHVVVVREYATIGRVQEPLQGSVELTQLAGYIERESYNTLYGGERHDNTQGVKEYRDSECGTRGDRLSVCLNSN